MILFGLEKGFWIEVWVLGEGEMMNFYIKGICLSIRWGIVGFGIGRNVCDGGDVIFVACSVCRGNSRRE